MPFRPSSFIWWGAPRNFKENLEDRRVSWLELFYDLVYVIAIARITHHLSMHISLEGILEYTGLFALIFWGWLNGSLYHDIHGTEGLRTRLMTLWQMMIIAALAITLDQPEEQGLVYTTVVFMIMQLYITYLWWSVGLYDKEHRKYNLPYTIFYLISFGLMGLSLWLPNENLTWISPLILLFNYLPPFISNRILRREDRDLNLSSSMYERLGLFTIIVFGELVIGVVNGVSEPGNLNLEIWLQFCLAMAIVFSLWWLFFTLVGNREPVKGFAKATRLELYYVPALISLGLMGAGFTHFFEGGHGKEVFFYALAIFLMAISLITGLLDFPENFRVMEKPVKYSLRICALTFLLLGLVPLHIQSVYFLLLILILLVMEISYLNFQYYSRVRGK